MITWSGSVSHLSLFRKRFERFYNPIWITHPPPDRFQKKNGYASQKQSNLLMRQRAQFQISSPQDLLDNDHGHGNLKVSPPTPPLHPPKKMRPYQGGLLRDYGGLHNHSHLRSKAIFRGKKLDQFLFFSEVLPSDDPNPLKNIGYHSNRHRQKKKKNIQNSHLSLVKNDDGWLGPLKKKKMLRGWHIRFYLQHGYVIARNTNLKFTLKIKTMGSSRIKNAKRFPNQLHWFASHGFFWLVFFSTSLGFGLQVLCNSNPNRSFIFFGCICLLKRIPNLPSTGIPPELFHPPVNKWPHQHAGKKIWPPFTRRCQKCGKGNLSNHIDFDFQTGVILWHSSKQFAICFFEKSPKNCHTFAIKLDDPQKKKTLKKITYRLQPKNSL